ncbi:MAG: tRNA pseudouridine(55) synthase TruB [Bacteroidales bacterium]|nr:tRNA pseudouridine(55) synthase TruB [Bacteroidales bacterium]
MFDFESGEILLIDKPYTWTSFDVVNFIKQNLHRLLKKPIKIGHGGTLDPLATGLLIVLTNKKTKMASKIQNLPKTYEGTFVLGAFTPSFDKETLDQLEDGYPIDHITPELIMEKAKEMIGNQMQMPPQYSAIKVNGKRAYEYVRNGKTIHLSPRPITIYEFNITRIELPEVDFQIVCSKGTYIRSIARDFGDALETAAYLGSLCRTQIGKYKLEDAMHPKEFIIFVEKLIENKMIQV